MVTAVALGCCVQSEWKAHIDEELLTPSVSALDERDEMKRVMA
jgi:hypothetical protein